MTLLSRLVNSLIGWVEMLYFSATARIAAPALGTVGLEFDSFGRSLGFRMLLRGCSRGFEYLLHPMVHVRYLEFSFVRSCLPEDMGECLDVSSPRLFSLYIATHTDADLTMINPDPQDTSETAQVLRLLHPREVLLSTSGIEMLCSGEFSGKFDVVWSISVIEHIEGEFTDSDAVRLMFRALKPGGRLLLTFPVDREFRVQSSQTQQYGTQPLQSDGTYFFQRFYEPETIEKRLSAAIGRKPRKLCWFGERRRGWYDSYVHSCLDGRRKWAVSDVVEITRNFQEYESWSQMPGMGICGVMYVK